MEKGFQYLYSSLQEYCLDWAIVSGGPEKLKLRAVFDFNETFSGFAGHFPGNPILPAIVQLASVRFLAELGLKRQVQPVSYNRTKFRGVIQPNEKVDVRLELKKTETSWSGSFSLKDIDDNYVARGQCEFAIVN